MKYLLIFLFLLIPMSQNALEILSQISGVNLYSGTMDYQPDYTNVLLHAYGRKDKKDVEVWCRWKNGQPLFVWTNEVPRKKFEI